MAAPAAAAMFKEVLARMGGGLPGCRGAALVAIDGIVIEQWIAPRSMGGIRMEPVAGELTSVIKAARSASRNIEGEELAELTLKTRGWSGVVRAVGKDCFLIFVTSPDTLVGKTRFTVERAVPLIERELA